MPTVSELMSQNIGNTITNSQTWNGVIYNVKSYGAKGDGSTDDTAKIADAITAASTNGGIVYFPPGTYIVGSTLTFPSNVTAEFSNGAKLSVNTGITVTINGPINAGLYQIFSGAGTIAGSIQVPYALPQWWGAKGDGVTDDASAIQKAVNAHGAIVFPPAIYKIGAIVTIPSARYLYGQGSIFYTLNSIATMWSVPSANGDIQFHDMNVKGDVADFTAFKIDGNRVWVNKCTTFNVSLAIDSSGALLTVTECYLRGSNGVLIQGSAEVRTISDTVIQINAGGNGVKIIGGAGIRINNCDIMGGAYNLLVEATDATIASVKCTGCFFDQGTSHCVGLLHTGTGGIMRTKFSNCWFTGSTGGQGLRATGTVQGLQVSNCDIYGNASGGIVLGSSGGTVINNCVIAGSTTSSGISISAGVTDFTITGNHIAPGGGYGANQYGIYVNAGASDNYIIADNMLLGNTTANLVDTGVTGTNKIVKNNVGFKTENGGVATFSGTGAQTTFAIPHGLAKAPSDYNVNAGSAEANSNFYVTADGTNITVTYATAPAAGTNNVVLVWSGRA